MAVEKKQQLEPEEWRLKVFRSMGLRADYKIVEEKKAKAEKAQQEARRQRLIREYSAKTVQDFLNAFGDSFYPKTALPNGCGIGLGITTSLPAILFPVERSQGGWFTKTVEQLQKMTQASLAPYQIKLKEPVYQGDTGTNGGYIVEWEAILE